MSLRKTSKRQSVLTVKQDFTVSEGIVMSGTLSKLKVNTKSFGSSGWKKRFFILNDQCLCYFENQNSTKALGDILLTPETECREENYKGKKYCLLLDSPAIKSVYLAAENDKQVKQWKSAINAVILKSRELCRSIANLTDLRTKISQPERFLILQDDGISIHESILTTSKMTDMIGLRPHSVLKQNPSTQSISISTVGNGLTSLDGYELGVADNFEMWISFLTKRMQEIRVDPNYCILNYGEDEPQDEILLAGNLLSAHDKDHKKDWTDYYFEVTPKAIFKYPDINKRETLDVYIFSTNCTVFETTLSKFSFQLVTAEKVFHATSESKKSTQKWVATLRNCIRACKLDTWDPLCRKALEVEEEFYDIEFLEKKPLGIVLEKASEWPLVKLAHGKDDRIQKGSSLAYIDDESYMLSQYASVTQKLATWKPPLKLTFRRAPSMSGTLNKRSMRNGNVSGWKTRYFELSGGHLIYYENENENAAIKGDMRLMGCAVSLVPFHECKTHFCFRLVNGLSVLTMQAKDKAEMMRWASKLYYAVAVANGGGYLIVKERMALTGGIQNTEISVNIEDSDLPEEENIEIKSVAVVNTEPVKENKDQEEEEQQQEQPIVDEPEQEPVVDEPEQEQKEEVVVVEDIQLESKEENDTISEQPQDEVKQPEEEDDEEEDDDDEEDAFDMNEELDKGGYDSDEEEALRRHQEEEEQEEERRRLEEAIQQEMAQNDIDDDEIPTVKSNISGTKGKGSSKATLLSEVDDSELQAMDRQPLTEEDCMVVFRSLKMSAVDGNTNMLRPVNFSMFVRLTTGTQNLFKEMELFHHHFDKDNNGFVDDKEFCEGLISLEKKDPSHIVVRGVKTFSKNQMLTI